MPLSLAEIKLRAIQFAKDWREASRERADSQTFWNEFFQVFGRSRKLVATFEEPVKNLKGDAEFIDLFWPGTLIAEHKSRGKDLDKANTQAIGYIHNLANTNRADESPRYIIVSDFARIALHDLEDEKNSIEFPLTELHKHIRSFAFIAGYETRKLDPEDPANIKAVEKLANLHDQLEEAHFTGHPLERFLVRVLFCLFAEDTEIFEPESFKQFLLNHTKIDGSDLGPQLSRLFQVLDKPIDERPPNLPADLAAFPYVNGQLFAEKLEFPEFTSRQREALLDCARFQWARISPAIFGSLFQAAMQPKERRQIGAHYTSERDIMKLIRSLFLDDLRTEFESIKTQKKKLEAFHDKIASLKFLDPACGCGNFLVITYRELRLLELDILKALHADKEQRLLNIATLLRVNVDQMYGIEIEEWPARIAEVALWLLDHQMNQLASQTFGNHYARLPLKASPTIAVENALRSDWMAILSPRKCSFVLGNPPFVGKKEQNAPQKSDMALVWGEVKGAGLLDYVSAWYLKAAQYIQGTQINVAFVSTNSVTQGEQVGVIWPFLFAKFGIKINFGHTTFEWESEARGKAHVHVVIIGFSGFSRSPKIIYESDPKGNITATSTVANISPYLAAGSDTAVVARRSPFNSVPNMVYGSFALDDGNYTLTEEDRSEILKRSPSAKDYIKPFLGGQELIRGEKRYCIWLVNADPTKLRAILPIIERVESVRIWRSGRDRETTKELANTPSVFAEIRQPTTPYLAMPTLSSVRRRYIPSAFLSSDVIASNQIYVLPDATRWHFGVLTSIMHMSWVKHVCGRFKSDYRYSNAIVYNNFPWPTPTDAQRRRTEECAQAVLDAREPYLKSGSTLADLYDPLSMPKPLADAHAALDLAVDRAYRPQPFPSDRHRFEFLFALYEQLVAPLTAAPNSRRRSP